MSVAEVLAGNVRYFAARYKVSQVVMGEILGLTQAPVSQRTRGKRAFSVEELLRLSRYFGIPFERLLEGVAEVEL